MLTRWPIYDRVLLNLVDGSALSGLLIAKSGPLIVLSDCTLFAPSHEPQPVPGQVYVEREKVLFIQVAQPKGG